MTPRNSTATATATSSSMTRTERKRKTDRRAQREHRERAKAYVKELEEKVRVLTSDSKSDDRIAMLLEEQMRLKGLCNTLSAKLDRIRNIAGGDQTAGRRTPLTENSNEQPFLGKDEVQDVAADPVSATGVGPGRWSDVSIEEIFGTSDGYSAEALILGENQFDQDTNIFNEINIWDHQLAMGGDQILRGIDRQQNDGIGYTGGKCFGTNEAEGHCDGITLEDSSLEILMTTAGDDIHQTRAQIPTPFSLSNNDWSRTRFTAPAHIEQELDQVDSRTQIPPCISEGSVPEWLCLPNYEPPCTYRESVYHDMIQEARRERKAGRFDTSRPSLRRLLAKDPVDVLSFRLFHYMSTWGPLPMHLFLAVFWVHYLYLRVSMPISLWHVLLSQESYYQLPEFLRPRHIERLVPHRIGVNLLVWPDIRAVLIRDSDHVDPDAVAIDLTTRINPNWSAVKPVGCYIRSPASNPSFDLVMLKSVTEPKPEIHSVSRPESDVKSEVGCAVTGLDIIGLIEGQASTFAFWSVEESFLNCYPCFKGCRLR
ncbi:hypothetical protein BKA64DRAFT_714688 [Cadophora sp. MPI-SDFR-AT-0126]|nr:hypothetical protein BKA64DRAFT_714688 [Leotiomycetes sp. MPI-SDFR-AT-0126]